MNFEQALVAMRKGKKITRPKYDNFYYLIVDNKITFTNRNTGDVRFLIYVDDIMADDWQILDGDKVISNTDDCKSKDYNKELANAYQKGYYDGLGTGLNNGMQAGYKSVRDIENYFMSLLEKNKTN